MPVSVLEILRPVFLGFKFTNLENSVRATKNEISLDNTLPKSAVFFENTFGNTPLKVAIFLVKVAKIQMANPPC